MHIAGEAMKKLFLFLIFTMLLAATPAAVLSAADAFWGDFSKSYSIYNNPGDDMNYPGVYGKILVMHIDMQNSSHDTTFNIKNERGTSIQKLTLTGTEESYNRSFNYTTYGNINITIEENYTNAAEFPNSNLISWFQLDEGTGTSSTDEQSNNTMELGTTTANRPDWTTQVIINNGTEFSGSEVMRMNHSATGNNFTDINFSWVFAVKLDGANSNGYLMHQGELGSDDIDGQVYAKSGYDNATDTNSSAITWGFNALEGYHLSSNTSELNGTNMTSGHEIYIDSNFISSKDYNAELNVTYDHATNADVDVYVNDIEVGTLDGTSPDNITVNQSILQATNTISFTTNDTDENITNSSLEYYNKTTIEINTTLGTNKNFSLNEEAWIGLSVFKNTTNTTFTTYLNGTENSQANYSTGYNIINSTYPFYFGDGTSSTNYINGRMDEIYMFNTNISSSQHTFIYNQSRGLNPIIHFIWKRDEA